MTQQVKDASLIRDLHRRHEQVMDALKASRDDRATRAISQEMEALQAAVLYQVPDSWTEALMLLYHIRVACDQSISSATRDTEADERLQIAVDTLFDFMCCEVDADHGEIGGAFKAEAASAFAARRRRTGEAEE